MRHTCTLSSHDKFYIQAFQQFEFLPIILQNTLPFSLHFLQAQPEFAFLSLRLILYRRPCAYETPRGAS